MALLVAGIATGVNAQELIVAENASNATGVSADGSTLVGFSGIGNRQVAFSWSSSTGVTDLPSLAGNGTNATGVSADGTVIVGNSVDSNGTNKAVYWTGGKLGFNLGTLGPGASEANGISADGQSIVGSGPASGETVAYRWRVLPNSVPQALSLSTSRSGAYAASANGSTVVGFSGASGAELATVWNIPIAGGAITPTTLGTLGGTRSFAYGVSDDGSMVVGQADLADRTYQAFRYTGGTMTALGTLAGHSFSGAYGVSSDGKVVVGQSVASATDLSGFRWTEATGMQSVEGWLRSAGVQVTDGVTRIATATNADGSVVVGQTRAGYAYLARVMPTTPGTPTPLPPDNGIVEVPTPQPDGRNGNNFVSSLAGVSTATRALLSSAGMVLNGIHSQPLSYRIAQGQFTTWGAGDYGGYSQNSADGNVGVGEVGGGYNFGAVQLNAAVGYARNTQDLTQNGEVKASGTYLFGEALMPIYGNFWGVFSGLYQWGDADIKRGYELTGGGYQTTFKGSPDASVWALRARIEWERMDEVSGLRFNPYGDLSYTRAQADGYTEDSGGLGRATFDSRSDGVTDLRLGINAAYPLSFGNKTRLIGVMEGAYRFDDKAPDVTARFEDPLLSGYRINLPGAEFEQTWVRGGIGIESMLGGGKAYMMLNGATEGETPTVWLNARYQVDF